MCCSKDEILRRWAKTEEGTFEIFRRESANRRMSGREAPPKSANEWGKGREAPVQTVNKSIERARSAQNTVELEHRGFLQFLKIFLIPEEPSKNSQWRGVIEKISSSPHGSK